MDGWHGLQPNLTIDEVTPEVLGASLETSILHTSCCIAGSPIFGCKPTARLTMMNALRYSIGDGSAMARKSARLHTRVTRTSAHSQS